MAPSPAPQASKEPQQRKRPARTNGGVKIAGTLIPFDDNDVDLSKGPSPTPLFPSYHPSPPAPLSATEKAQVASFLSLRSRIHEGPFYTILDNTSRIGKSAKASAAATFDPFEGMPTYSQKYVKKRRRLPKLSARPYGALVHVVIQRSYGTYNTFKKIGLSSKDGLTGETTVLKFFPPELHPTLDPKNHKPSSSTTTKRTLARPSTVKKETAPGSGDEEDPTGGDKDPDEEAIHEAVDDEFDEDEDDDAGGDYNAEQYFDDGGDDMGDEDGDDGGGGGGDYY
ncbi:MAG: hypothetical protein Q9169_006220 [Polycauliona sp. 2 TL-2023]